MPHGAARKCDGQDQDRERLQHDGPVKSRSVQPLTYKYCWKPRFQAPNKGRIGYLPQTSEPDVQTNGTVMPVQQVV